MPDGTAVWAPERTSAWVGPASSDRTAAPITAFVAATPRVTGHSLASRTSHTSTPMRAGVWLVTGAGALPPPDETVTTESIGGTCGFWPDPTTTAPDPPQPAARRQVQTTAAMRMLMGSPRVVRTGWAGGR